MNQAEITIAIDPAFFGAAATEQNVESFAHHLNKNVEKMFNIKSDYSVRVEGNGYRVTAPNTRLELEISEFIESNWHKVSPSVL